MDAELRPSQPTPEEELNSASFDEVLPEEKGFAGIFESQIKPPLIKDVKKRLQVRTESLRRRPAFLALSLGSLAIFIAAIVLAMFRPDLVMPALAVGMAATVAGLAAVIWFLVPGFMVEYNSLPRPTAARLVAARFGLSYDAAPADVPAILALLSCSPPAGAMSTWATGCTGNAAPWISRRGR